MLQPLDKILVLLLCHPALLRGLFLRYLEALVGRFIAVPIMRVVAREVFASSVAEVDLQWACLRGVAVPHELSEVLDLRTWAGTALNRLDCPTLGIGLRRPEEQPIYWLESAGDLKKLHRFLLLLHHTVDMVRCFLTDTPFDPRRLPMRRSHRPTLLETWSPQGLMVNTMCTRSGASPLRVMGRQNRSD